MTPRHAAGSQVELCSSVLFQLEAAIVAVMRENMAPAGQNNRAGALDPGGRSVSSTRSIRLCVHSLQNPKWARRDHDGVHAREMEGIHMVATKIARLGILRSNYTLSP